MTVIVSHVQRISQLHPFKDGNTRVCYILLNRLLKEENLNLSLLFNPNRFDCFSIKENVAFVKQGQDYCSRLLLNSQTSIFEDDFYLSSALKAGLKKVKIEPTSLPSNEEFTHFLGMLENEQAFLKSQHEAAASADSDTQVALAQRLDEKLSRAISILNDSKKSEREGFENIQRARDERKKIIRETRVSIAKDALQSDRKNLASTKRTRDLLNATKEELERDHHAPAAPKRRIASLPIKFGLGVIETLLVIPMLVFVIWALYKTWKQNKKSMPQLVVSDTTIADNGEKLSSAPPSFVMAFEGNLVCAMTLGQMENESANKLKPKRQ